MTDPFGVCLEPSCNDTHQLPPTTTMIGNLLKSIKSIVRGLITSNKVLVDADTAASRLDICRSCPFFIADLVRCSKCGCYMESKVKFIEVSCPDGRW